MSQNDTELTWVVVIFTGLFALLMLIFAIIMAFSDAYVISLGVISITSIIIIFVWILALGRKSSKLLVGILLFLCLGQSITAILIVSLDDKAIKYGWLELGLLISGIISIVVSVGILTYLFIVVYRNLDRGAKLEKVEEQIQAQEDVEKFVASSQQEKEEEQARTVTKLIKQTRKKHEKEDKQDKEKREDKQDKEKREQKLEQEKQDKEVEQQINQARQQREARQQAQTEAAEAEETATKQREELIRDRKAKKAEEKAKKAEEKAKKAATAAPAAKPTATAAPAAKPTALAAPANDDEFDPDGLLEIRD